MGRPAPAARFDWAGFALLCGIFLAVAFAWHTKFVFPLKVFVVFLHELSHGLAALLTGGSIERVLVTDNLGGLCITSGGIPMVVVSSGYLGSLLFGVLFLLIATRTRLSGALCVVTGVLVAIVAWRFMPDGSFGRRAAAAMGVLLACAAFLPAPWPSFLLRVLGTTSCLYAILDIKSDLLDTDHPQSDASALAAMTGVPPVLWGFLWAGVSVMVTAIAAKWALIRPAAADVGKKRS
jgi:hypothetical protein